MTEQARPFSKATQLAKSPSGIGLKKRGRKPAPVIEADIWREGLGDCAVCVAEGVSCGGPPIEGHHCVARRTLKKLGLTDFLMDKRNRLAVCAFRHEQHTSGYRPIPRRYLPPSVFEFAEELNLGWYLDRFYPAEESAA